MKDPGWMDVSWVHIPHTFKAGAPFELCPTGSPAGGGNVPPLRGRTAARGHHGAAKLAWMFICPSRGWRAWVSVSSSPCAPCQEACEEDVPVEPLPPPFEDPRHRRGGERPGLWHQGGDARRFRGAPEPD